MVDNLIEPNDITHIVGQQALSQIRTLEVDIDLYLDIVRSEWRASITSDSPEMTLKDVSPNLRRLIMYHLERLDSPGHPRRIFGGR